jgi:hypothetical protein
VIADVKEELRQGRRCQIYATFTGEKDVTLRLETVLRQAGIRVAVLRSSVPTDKREDWYDRQLKAGIEVVNCHPKLVETGLDLLPFSTLYFYETGYSLHTLRQANRRSWRIGHRHPVRVKFVILAAPEQVAADAEALKQATDEKPEHVGVARCKPLSTSSVGLGDGALASI